MPPAVVAAFAKSLREGAPAQQRGSRPSPAQPSARTVSDDIRRFHGPPVARGERRGTGQSGGARCRLTPRGMARPAEVRSGTPNVLLEHVIDDSRDARLEQRTMEVAAVGHRSARAVVSGEGLPQRVPGLRHRAALPHLAVRSGDRYSTRATSPTSIRHLRHRRRGVVGEARPPADSAIPALVRVGSR